MEIYLLFFYSFILLLLPNFVFGQIVTSSYDRTILSINPASATTRHFSQLALFSTLRNSNSDIPEIRSDGGTAQWIEEIKMNKTGIYFTGHGKFAPELYLSSDNATKTLKLEQGGAEEQESKINMINSMVNVGLRLTRDFSFGIKYYNPKFTYKEDFSITYDDASTLRFSNDAKSSIRGIGAGIVYQYLEQWYLGAYYVAITEKTKMDQTFTDVDSTTSTYNETLTFKSKLYGAGVSYLEGTRGKGVRAELALSKMIHPAEMQAEDGEEFYIALEWALKQITVGANLKLRKNLIYDNVEILDYIVGDKTFSSDSTPYLGGFVSFGFSHGHTVGISAVFYKSEAKKQLFGQDQESETNVSQYTFNYAYLF